MIRMLTRATAAEADEHFSVLKSCFEEQEGSENNVLIYIRKLGMSLAGLRSNEVA